MWYKKLEVLLIFKILVLQLFCTILVYISANFGVSSSNIPGEDRKNVIFWKLPLNVNTPGQTLVYPKFRTKIY